MDVRLDGKVALITGASRGIGRAIATAFAEAGAAVMICSRRSEALESAAAFIKAAAPGGRVEWFEANAGDFDAAGACVHATVERLGSLDILVNNAATNPYFGPLMGLDTVRAQKTVQVNQCAPLVWTQAAWQASMSERGGSIINLASIGGLSIEAGIGWYNVTKAALIQLTRQLASELAPSVRVNALAPGVVKTDFSRALWERNENDVALAHPLQRLGEVQDVASAALFLASDSASWITGHTLVVDGGTLVKANASA